MRPCGSAGLDTLHGFRRASAWLFFGLVLAVCGERRLADDHYNRYNLTRAETGIASAETLDGDEVALRLIAVDDASAPVPTTTPAPAPLPLVLHGTVAPRSPAVDLPPLRAPPRLLSAAV